jgi:hypothetical protein
MSGVSNLGRREIHVMSRTENPWRVLSLGLYYPAMVGTAFVQLAQRLNLVGNAGNFLADPGVQFGLVLLFLFSASFVGSHDVSPEEYRSRQFALDVVEVALIFFAYVKLGLFDNSIPAPDYAAVYFSIAGIVLLNQLWVQDAPPQSRARRVTPLRVAAILFFFSAGLIAANIPPLPVSLHKFFLCGLLIVAVLYVVSLRRAA